GRSPVQGCWPQTSAPGIYYPGKGVNLMKNNNSSYKEAVEYLYSLQKYGIKFGLSKTSNILDAFGNPHHGQHYIHIAGTNGKGSVAAMLESILMKSGLKVGFYCSPHLVRFTERFRINREEMPQEIARDIILELRDIINPKHPPTFFEVTTAMALIYFVRQKTDIAIMEVGMGGRLDATNVIDPLVSVITGIALDHQFFLGSHIIDIAREKAGIIKQGVDLVTAEKRPFVFKLFENICKEKNARFWRVGRDIRYRRTPSGLNYYGLKRTLRHLELSLKGRFQNRNATLALAVSELLEKKGFRISSEDIADGLKHISWPGRLQVVGEKPLIVLDGGHNPNAVKEMTDSIVREFQYRQLILIIGIMEDKDIKEIIQSAVTIADYVIYTKPDYYRSADPITLERSTEDMKKPGEIIPSISDAIKKALKIATSQDMILITGSLFTVGEALICIDPNKYRSDGF
ncbi:bifunctional folylpolyglutamate synthase/dihydrofolate synthase, partial [Thermodesulfobacteriota bacterium]